MMRMRRSFVLAGAAISVVVLGILSDMATNLVPNSWLPPLWVIWGALVIVALLFVMFTFWQDRTIDHNGAFNHPLRTGPPKTALRHRYLQHLIDSYQYLEFKGIVQFERLPLRMSLESVFVNLWAQPELSSGATLAEELRLAGRKIAEERRILLEDELELIVESAKPVQIEEALIEHDALVVLGDPGSGKSTLLKHLALQTAMRFDREQRLPILLPLAAYANALEAQPQLSLREFLSGFYLEMQEFPESPAVLFDEALQNGRALVLLDGLDEVHNPDERSRVVHHVKSFYLNYRYHTDRSLAVTGQSNKFAITSRIVGYREVPLEAEGVFHLSVLDFNDEQITQFAENWCRTYEVAQSGDTPKATRDARQEKEKLLKAIFGNPGVKILAANPLLLTILALIHRQGTELPSRRAELYELYLTTLIKTWNRARNIAGIPVGSMDDKETVKILAPLAYWMHLNRPSGTARRRELEREVTRHFTDRRKLALDEAEREASRFLDDVRQYSGLLAERGPDAYGFVHLTFEEYLAARHLIFQGQVDEQKSLQLIRKHAYDPAWREVILLALGYLGLIANEEEKTALYVRGILDDQPLLEHLGENVELAGAALKDLGRVSVGEDCYKEVIDRLLNTITDSAPAIITRAKCGDVLGELGDPRLNTMEWCEVPEGEFLMGCMEEEFSLILEEGIEFYRTQSWQHSTKDAQKALRRFLPQHSVLLPTYFVARVPVTNQQLHSFWKNGGYDDRSWWGPAGVDWLVRSPTYEDMINIENWRRRNGRTKPASGKDSKLSIPNRPAAVVTWHEAIAFCNWFTEQLRLSKQVVPEGYVVRLPTEAEWEKAARGTDGRFWPWGNEWDANSANTREANLSSTNSVGVFVDNRSPYGVVEMAGNVREWCHSLSAGYPYESDDGRENPEVEGDRAVRGGSWYLGRYAAHCAYRRHHPPDGHYEGLGFRVVIGPKLD